MEKEIPLKEQLIKLENPPSIIRALVISIAIPLIFILVGLIGEDTQVALYFGIFLLVIPLAVWDRDNYLKKVIKALKKGVMREGKVVMIVDPSTEDDNYAKIYVKENLHWDCKFDYFGWTPNDGCSDAKLYFSKNYHYPLLVVLENGLFLPYQVTKSTSKTEIMGHTVDC